jgi:hypothetical protein
VPLDQGGGIGWASRGVEVALPLDPRHLLLLCEGSGLPSGALRPGAPMPVFRMTRSNVTYYNALQVQESRRFLYGVDADWELALQVCRDSPHLRSPDRKRVTTSVVRGAPRPGHGKPRHG